MDGEPRRYHGGVCAPSPCNVSVQHQGLGGCRQSFTVGSIWKESLGDDRVGMACQFRKARANQEGSKKNHSKNEEMEGVQILDSTGRWRELGSVFQGARGGVGF